MSQPLTVVPAYGRDYKDELSVLRAWETGKDFQIQDISCKDSGRYINLSDAQNYGVAAVRVRYNKLSDVTIIPVT